MNEQIEKWDLFISHASEDKAAFVEPLAHALRSFGVQVWYDKFALKVGDSLSRSIDRGLAKSDFGLVVISPFFIAKNWPEYELRGLTAKELAGRRKVILPIWHKVTMDEVLAFSPPLADKKALSTEGTTPAQLAAEVIKVVRPDIFTRLHRRRQFLEMVGRAKIVRGALKGIRAAPIQHATLPAETIGRIRLIRASLLTVFPQSMDYWLEGFMRDSHPSDEVKVWEHLGAALLEYAAMHPHLSPLQQAAAFRTLFAINAGEGASAKKLARSLPADALDKLREIHSSALPAYELAGAPPFLDGEWEVGEPDSEPLDREHFPHDLPEGLVREVMKSDTTPLPARKQQVRSHPSPRRRKASKPR